MKKYNRWFLVLLLSMFILAGCGENRSHQMYQNTEEGTEVPKEDSENQESEDIDDNQTNDEEYVEGYEGEWIGKGIYHEKIDSHTIKVEMDEEIEDYQLTEWAQEDLEDYETGKEISFYYYENNEELFIDEINENDFDWSEEYGFDMRYNHHNRNGRNHHRNNQDRHQRNKRHHRRHHD